MNLATGIGPLDDRIAGLRRGAAYLLTGGADTAKLAFILQFLAEGLRDGERAALICAAAPEDILEQADYLGIDLTKHWHDGTCLLLGFKGDYPRRIVHAPDPANAFDELERLVSPPVDRIGIDPGSFLWSTRAGTSMAQGFADWAERSGATVVASVAAGLEDRPDPSTEWVLQRASGVFHFARLSSGLHEVDVRRFTPPLDVPGPITLELVADRGLVGPTGRIERRSSDRRGSREDPLLLVELGGEAPEDLVSWLEREQAVERVDDGMALLRRLQAGPAGLVCLYVERSRTDEAVELLRTGRPVTTAPLILLSDHELRSSDRAAALDAGADDVLSGGVDLKELDARIRRARASARPDATPEPTPGPIPVDGLMPAEEFRQLLRDRLESSDGVFSLLRFEAPATDDFDRVLIDSVRAESGDLVAALDGGFGILLQDARTRQAEAFLSRVQAELRRQGHAATLEAEILFSTDEGDRIRRLAGA
ncbi:MAG: RAD55 family ATPase [Gemmatimonadota bacterium]